MSTALHILLILMLLALPLGCAVVAAAAALASASEAMAQTLPPDWETGPPPVELPEWFIGTGSAVLLMFLWTFVGVLSRISDLPKFYVGTQALLVVIALAGVAANQVLPPADEGWGALAAVTVMM